MTYTVTIDCDNAAFEDYPAGEVARLLRAIAYRLEGQESLDNMKLTDLNGNTCGKCEVER